MHKEAIFVLLTRCSAVACLQDKDMVFSAGFCKLSADKNTVFLTENLTGQPKLHCNVSARSYMHSAKCRRCKCFEGRCSMLYVEVLAVAGSKAGRQCVQLTSSAR